MLTILKIEPGEDPLMALLRAINGPSDAPRGLSPRVETAKQLFVCALIDDIGVYRVALFSTEALAAAWAENTDCDGYQIHDMVIDEPNYKWGEVN